MTESGSNPLEECPNCGKRVNEVYIEDGRCHRCETAEAKDSESN